MRLITDSDTPGYAQGFEGIPVGTRVWIAPWAGSLVRNQWAVIIEVTAHPEGLKHGQLYNVRLEKEVMRDVMVGGVKTSRPLGDVWLSPDNLMAGPFVMEAPEETPE